MIIVLFDISIRHDIGFNPASVAKDAISIALNGYYVFFFFNLHL